MWTYESHQREIDEPLQRERVEAGRGIVGCEMHDLNGWGLTQHMPRSHHPCRHSFLAHLWALFFRT